MDYTGGIGTFVITSEAGIGSGIRRIEAITGLASEEAITERFNALDEVASKLNVGILEVGNRVDAIADELSKSKKQISQSM